MNTHILLYQLRDGIGFCATAPQYALDFRQAGRELARVDDVGNVTIADDITLDEAKFVITELAKAVLSGLQDRRNRS